jgi:hypothetical protein
MHFVKGKGKVCRVHGQWRKDKRWMADIAMYKYTGLLKMIVELLTTCHTQYT